MPRATVCVGALVFVLALSQSGPLPVQRTSVTSVLAMNSLILQATAADLFNAKLMELSNGAMTIDQFPGAQLGQEPQMLQKSGPAISIS
jgi:TRAP-type C4-dicarboxylate transport system substrate-binding protein